MSDVAAIGALTLRTPDVGRMRDHYERVLGLTVSQEGSSGDVYLAAGAEHHCLHLIPDRQPTLERVSLRLAPGLEAESMRARLQKAGASCSLLHDPAPGESAAVDFVDPAGNHLRAVVVTDEQGPGSSGLGIRPEKLGHVAHRTDDVAAIARWYEDVLDFKVADWIGDFFVFMRCGVEHHVLNFIHAEPFGQIHHSGYQLSSPQSLMEACDILARERISVIWGPGRHGAGHNLFIFYRDPDEHIVELFCQLDLMLDERLGAYDARPWHRDRPQRPKVWTDLAAGANLWGQGPPAEMHRVPEYRPAGSQEAK